MRVKPRCTSTNESGEHCGVEFFHFILHFPPPRLPSTPGSPRAGWSWRAAARWSPPRCAWSGTARRTSSTAVNWQTGRTRSRSKRDTNLSVRRVWRTLAVIREGFTSFVWPKLLTSYKKEPKNTKKKDPTWSLARRIKFTLRLQNSSSKIEKTPIILHKYDNQYIQRWWVNFGNK